MEWKAGCPIYPTNDLNELWTRVGLLGKGHDMFNSERGYRIAFQGRVSSNDDR